MQPNMKGPGEQNSAAEHQQREVKRDESPLPGVSDSQLPSSELLQYRLMTLTDPMTPVYLLDASLLIVDSNEACSLAFDGTIEEKRHRHILEWVNFLDNGEEVAQRGRADFSESDNQPSIHVEEMCYTSERYGALTAMKRAYRLHTDDGRSVLGWLVVLDLRFDDREREMQYQQDLVTRLSAYHLWSEYAFVSDRVLSRTKCRWFSGSGFCW